MVLIYLFILSYWAKAYGGPNEDLCFDMKKTTDGGYIMIGDSRTYYSPGEVLVMKVDSDGELQWAKDYGMPPHDKTHHECWSVDLTSDSGYILGGRIDTLLGGQYRTLIIKIDAVGNIQWSKRFGSVDHSAFNNYGYMKCIRETSDGNYIVAGWDLEFGLGNHECVIMKLNTSGNTIWVKDYTGTGTDEHSEIRSIQQTADGGYIACGHIDCDATSSLEYALVMKLDANGNLDWWKAYGLGHEDYYANWIEQTSDGGYIVAGDSSAFFFTAPGILVMKLDSIGDVEWSNVYVGDGGENSRYVQQTTDGDYIVCGITASSGAIQSDVFLMKLNPDGSIEWAKRFEGDVNEIATCVLEIPDGYIASGYTESYGQGASDFMLMKFQPDGDIPGCPVYDCIPEIHPIPIDPVIPGIYSCIPPNTHDFPIVDTSVTPVVVDICGAKIEETLIETKSRLSVLPTVGNRFKIQVTLSTYQPINLSIYDLSGRLVKSFSLTPNPLSLTTAVEWDAKDDDGKSVSSGIYYCELRLDGHKTQKVIVVR